MGSSDRVSTRRGQLRKGDRPWGGSLRMRFGLPSTPSVPVDRIHAETCEATNRNVIQGRFGQASEPIITKPFPVDRSGKWRACAGTVHVLIRGDLHGLPRKVRRRGPLQLRRVGLARNSGTESRKRIRAMQKSAEVIVPSRTPHCGREGLNDEVGEESSFDSMRGKRFDAMSRPGSTGSASNEQPALGSHGKAE